MILPLLFSFFLSGLFGYLFISILWPSSRDQIVLKTILAAGVGFGLSSCAYFLWLLTIGPVGYFGGEVAVIFGCAGIFFLTYKKPNQGNEHNGSLGPLDPRQWHRGIVLCFNVFLFLAACAFIFFSLKEPHGGWDAWAIWNMRARFLFRGGEEWRLAFLPLLLWGHLDYPLLLPLSVARSWYYVGAETLMGPILISLVFTAATIGLTASAIHDLRGRTQGYMAGIAILGTQWLIKEGSSQYADIPLSFYFLSTFVFISYQQRMRGSGGFSALAGITAGLSAWTKNEGLLFVGSLIVAFFISATLSHKFKDHLKPMLSFFAGLIPIAIIIFIFKIKLAPPNDLVSALGWQTISKIMDLSRYFLTGRNFIEEIFKLMWPLMVYLIFFGITDKKEWKSAIFVPVISIVLMLIGYFFTYIITYQDLHWHLDTSLNRLLVSLWPSIVFSFFLLVRPPEEGAQR